MNDAPVVVGVSLVLILVIAAAFVLARRKHRLSDATPKDRYQRDMREIQLETYRQTKPRPARQFGDPKESSGLGGGVGGFGGGLG
jgi:hypothetical protein